MSLLDTTQLALQAAMQGSMLRQTLLTNNLANADTPGSQRQDVNFQATLQNALASGQPLSQVSFQPYTQPGTLAANGNGVDPNQESAYIAENGLLYQQLTEVAGGREQILLAAMGMR